MKRFRATIIAICLILAWLGFADLNLLLRNPNPTDISITDLESTGAPREWLTVHDGYQDLTQAINMSGTMEVGSYLVPLKQSQDDQHINIWFETRDPQIVDILNTYYFLLETKAQQQHFFQENQQFFSAQREITGMTVANLVADSNRKKLSQLLQHMDIPQSENTIFISEGKKPAIWRGIFFMTIAIIGLIKVYLSSKTTS
ncbi:hypothetical protein SAMN05660420_00716 [Desulfuromusa kysingii]|uniref:Uncharacterized protein n=1 Tax=Desulfuromusa kysingii TaxID=37625 RepID=A0A1H3WWQ5_9BACT|nr:hypothetical protein [Desulfuromusa kysingii]SDZ91597.1 hypothetical protein SAMN05660420_00716 [Desulfuromusa kysingii]